MLCVSGIADTCSKSLLWLVSCWACGDDLSRKWQRNRKIDEHLHSVSSQTPLGHDLLNSAECSAT